MLTYMELEASECDINRFQPCLLPYGNYVKKKSPYIVHTQITVMYTKSIIILKPCDRQHIINIR